MYNHNPFSHSHILAFASSPPRPDSPTSPSTTQPRTYSRPPSGTFGISPASSSPSAGGLTNLFFSRGAPATSGGSHAHPSVIRQRPILKSLLTTGLLHPPGLLPQASTSQSSISGHYQLRRHHIHPSSRNSPHRNASRHSYRIMRDGNSLIMFTEDSMVVRVFQVMPCRCGAFAYVQAPVRTPGVVEVINSLDGGRWVAVGTRKHTVQPLFVRGLLFAFAHLLGHRCAI